MYITKIKQFNIRIFNHILSQMDCKDFTCEQSFVLKALWDKKELTCNEIAALTGLAPNSVTALVNNLINNGMVERKQNPNDRRQVIIAVTEKGLKAREDYEKVLAKVIGIGFGNFTEQEYEEFQNYLEKLCTNYEKFFNSSL